MSGMILCQIKRAENPFYVESISTNIYSIEELCYYLHHNVYLIDHTIINEHLCDWIRDDLGLGRLYLRLYEHLGRDESISSFILPIFKEIHYLSHSEFIAVQESISNIESQPAHMRRKLKGDYLVNNKMYANAVREYSAILQDEENKNVGKRFQATVWGNMGSAYARLFLYEEAAKCYEKAYQLEATVSIYEKYLCALRLSMTEEEFSRAAAQNYVKVKALANLRTKMNEIRNSVEEDENYQEFRRIVHEKKEGHRKAYEEGCERMLEQITRDYYKSV